MATFRPFKQKDVPWLEELKSILKGYPDDQILKELIQNADDAGAQNVIVLYDKTYHPAKTLLSPKLEQHQGPALYVYNDAIFGTDDWKSIQNPKRSAKLKEPSKIGRFGLGFNSVYHLTDVPSILSGNRVAFLDPQEEYGIDEGTSTSLSKELLSGEYHDQFSPYIIPMFNCTEECFGNKDGFPGTIFRLPLRIQDSKLGKVYNEVKLYELFHTFSVDAELSLQFLKNVQSLAVFEWQSRDQVPMPIFSVHSSLGEINDFHSCRKQFISKINEGISYSYFCDVEFETQIYKHTSMSEPSHIKSRYLVLNMYEVDEISPDLKTQIDELSMLSCVGISMPVNADSNEDLSYGSLDGRAFCFLPLPDSENPGLPVNVHGYFALRDDRSSINWPNINASHDVNAIWNKAIVSELFPRAYAKFIKCSIEHKLGKRVVYNAWPTISKLEQGVQGTKCNIWKDGIRIFLDQMTSIKYLYTELNGGVWMKPNHESAFINTKRDAIIQKVLLRNDCQVVSPPQHVLDLLKWGNIQIHKVTPELLCDHIRQDDLEWLTSDEKFHLLHYILECDTEDQCDLHNVKLLPLHDGSFTNFCREYSQPIYIQNDHTSCEIFPNCSKRFLSSNLLPEDLAILKGRGDTQLKEISDSDTVALLKTVLPYNWTSTRCKSQTYFDWLPGYENQPTWNWLMNFWEWLSKNCSRHSLSLEKFTGIPLIPLSKPQNTPQDHIRLARLEHDTLINKQSSEELLSESVCKFLEEVGAIVLFDMLPTQITHHPTLEKFVLHSASESILNILVKHFKCERKYETLQTNVSEYLKSTITKKHSFTYIEADTIKHLPIFKDQYGNFTSLDSVRSISIPCDFYDVPVAKNRIRVHCRCILIENEADKVAFRLGARSPCNINKKEFIISHILHELRDNTKKWFTEDEIGKIMEWIFKDYRLDKDVMTTIHSLKFVTTTGELKSPTQLYNPHDENLKILFRQDDVFPTGRFAREPLLGYLKCIGLKDESQVSTEELLKLAKEASLCTRKVDTAAREKSMALLAYLNKYPNLLLKKVIHVGKFTSFGEAVGSIAWLPCESKPPANYPCKVKWYGQNDTFYRPKNMGSISSAYIQGSVKALVDMSNACKGLLQAFGWSDDDTSIKVEDVVKHLNKIVTCFQSSTGITLTPGQERNLEASVERIFDFFNRTFLTSKNHLVNLFKTHLESLDWVWTGSGFTSPTQIAFKVETSNLPPFLYTVPKVLKNYEDLLKELGVKLSFRTIDYVNVLKTLKHKTGDKPLNESEVGVVNNVLKVITSLEDAASVSCEYALDEKYILHPVAVLTYNDMKSEDKRDEADLTFTHDTLTKAQAEKLGIVSLRQRRLDRCSTSYEFESEFGQVEKLTTRLKGILKDCPDEATVLKELIQNADDAKATEVHVVYDPSKRDTSGVVSSWGPMHSAPAICVYNNKPFTDEDIKGIQMVGIGGKTADSAKAGRFGIGFNIVYHLTDCPTFVTKNEKLCIFDPHMKYVPLKNIAKRDTKPGITFDLQGEDGCLAMYPDMIKGYLGDYEEIDLKNGTVFRFPLRSSSMASDISNHRYTDDDDIQPLLNKFQEEAKTCLLFLKHIRKISISEIDKSNGELKCKYTVTSEVIDPTGSRRNLHDCMKSYNYNPIHKMPQVNSSFDLKIVDSLGYRETWMISECLGVDNLKEGVVEESSNDGSKKLLPTGGVAALIHVDVVPRKYSGNPFQRTHKAFTLLPQNVISLPVHVNGTFEVEQTRKHLLEFQAKPDDEHIDWNCLLVTKVIAPAYANLIQSAGKRFLRPTWKEDFERNCTLYDDIFPSNVKQLRGIWKLLATSTLSYLAEKKMKVLPVVRSFGETEELLKIEWHHPARSNVFFNNLPPYTVDGKPSELPQFLIATKFNLLTSKSAICNAFQKSDVKAEFVSPSKVMQHLKTSACPFSKTAFQTITTLKSVLEYCFKGDKQVHKDMTEKEKEEIHILNRNTFISLAEKIETSAIKYGVEWDFEFLSEASEVLVAQMKLTENTSFHDPNFLKDVSQISFIPKIQIMQSLQEIHLPFRYSEPDSTGHFIPYAESVPESYTNLAWSTAWILPDWAALSEMEKCHEDSFNRHLGISFRIILDKILRHIKNMCLTWEKETARCLERNDTVLVSRGETIKKLVKDMLEFLKKHWMLHETTIVKCLTHIPICPVDNYPILVRASNVAVNLNDTDGKALKPYLYRIPDEWMEYIEVLNCLGAQREVSFDQLAGVLECIQKKYGDKRMADSKDKHISYAAIRCLFHLLMGTEGKCQRKVRQLFLPTITDKMKKSTELYYINMDEIKNMDLELANLSIVIPLSTCVPGFSANEDKLIKLLPEELRPKDLRDTMNEQICNSNEKCPRGADCPFLLRVKRMISSQEMQIVLLRLIQNQLDTKVASEDHKSKISILLDFQNVKCMQELQTGWFDSEGNLVLPGRTSKKVFLARAESLLYLEHQDIDIDINFLHFIELAQQIDSLCKLDLDKEHLSYLREVVACRSVNELNGVLTALKIPEYDKPGTKIPKDIYHLLDDDLTNTFYAGDLAVLKRPIPDSLGEGDQKRLTNERCNYIYCRIINKFRSDNEELHPLGSTYIVDIGDECSQKVAEIWLYRFRRRPAHPSKTEIHQPDNEAVQKKRKANEKLIQRQVKAASVMSDSDKFECLRRLLRMWHPEKRKEDPGDAVFPYLKEQIEEYIDEVTASSLSHFCNQLSEEFTLPSEVIEHSTISIASIPSTLIQRNPDLNNARLWFTQAEEDYREAVKNYPLDHVDNDKSLAWLAFMLQQTAEKALKAVWFWIDGQDVRTHNLSQLVRHICENKKTIEQSETLRNAVKALEDSGCDAIRSRYPEDGTDRTTKEIYNGMFDAEETLKQCGIILEEVRAIIVFSA